MSEVKIANPGPLGLCGFALTTFILSVANAGWMPGSKDALIVVGLALFYGGIAQLLAGMWEFRSGNVFGATAFSSYGAFWLSFAALFVVGLGGAGAVVSANALGWYLAGWGFFTLIMLVAALRTNGATALVFILLLIAYILLAWGAFSGSTTITHIGGYVGILTALAAWYAAFAALLSGVSGGSINLPVMPMAQPVAARK